MDSQTPLLCCLSIITVGWLPWSGGLAWCADDPRCGPAVSHASAARPMTTSSEHTMAPRLVRTWQQKADTAMKHFDLAWSEATLDPWLAESDKFIADSRIVFPGFGKRKVFEHPIAHLKVVSGGDAFEGTQPGRIARHTRPAKQDLKNASLQRQVTAINYCGDTYTVTTADGKVSKIQEFNMRFKTDSSDFGPRSRRPVLVGAATPGDRASVVFAAPNEISTFVSEDCPTGGDAAAF